MFEFRLPSILWRVPADTYEQAVAWLCRIHGWRGLPKGVRFVGRAAA